MKSSSSFLLFSEFELSSESQMALFCEEPSSVSSVAVDSVAVRISIWIKEKRKKERGKVEQNFDGLVRGVGRIPQGDDWRKKKKKKQETKIL
ncbi:hypothetical protein RB195_018758 [Necator americanus]|uniref:Uncharacterized protein n=1 Tax=Necator americanus TaxID=51031 RepID=A0ABR1CCF1_NECAM